MLCIAGDRNEQKKKSILQSFLPDAFFLLAFYFLTKACKHVTGRFLQ
jgi:hypothetical protein